MRTERVSTGTDEGRSGSEASGRRRWRFLRELPVLIVIALVLALVIKTFFVQAFSIPSVSMDPTLRVGDRVLVEKVVKHPHRGWIVVFGDPNPALQPHRGWWSSMWHWLGQGLGISTSPNEDFIKRVIGLPGETVELRRGAVSIDGERLNEPYLQASITAHGRDTRPFGPCVVPPDHVFVMGDNRPASSDSRFGLGHDTEAGPGQCSGAVAEDLIVGRALLIVWPPGQLRWIG